MTGDHTPSEGTFALPRLARPVVDAAARVQASVHTKLLAGFLLGALLLLAMGVVSVLVIERMDDRVDELVARREETDQARQMIYLVTAQSHFRAMALITEDPLWNGKIDQSKDQFTGALDTFTVASGSATEVLVVDLRRLDERYQESGQKIAGVYATGDLTAALDLHLAEEHEISHELEDALNGSIASSDDAFQVSVEAFDSDRALLTIVVAMFSGVSVVIAVSLGLVLSWAFVRPVRQVDHVLGRIARGDFSQRVDVPNRDEFGTLSAHINQTNTQLATLYGDLESLNAGLQQQVSEKVAELERANRLRRYLSPQVADSLLSGDMEVSLTTRRSRLTVFFSDIRGFTAMSETVEPEELIDRVNGYLTEMTEIVFRHGGTLDKYVGDAVMVFFGDPVAYDDHAARAVRVALEMRQRLTELQQQWSLAHEETLTVGMGISTGYVTVGNIGSPARIDYTVYGNAVNLAARLADAARPGQILVSEATLLEAEGLARGSLVETPELKGVGRPTAIYELDNDDEISD